MTPFRLIAFAGVAGLLTACAQTEAPTIHPEPTFDKFGGGSCTDGYIYVPGAAPQNPCIPEDECEPVYDSAGNIIDCLPPNGRPQYPNDGGSDDGGRSPDGGSDDGGRSPTGARN